MPGTIGTAFADLKRLKDILQTASRFGFGPLLVRAKVLEKLGMREPSKETGRETAPAPQRFRQMLESLGPTFVKFGQILSIRPDIIPAAWITELSKLQDSVSPMPFSDFERELSRDLGDDAKALFRSVEETPLASASIAQVHRAVTADGRDVVLKVRRPGIREVMAADMNILHYMAAAMQAVIEEAGIYNPEAIIAEFEKTLNAELDFRLEARNIERFYDNFAGSPCLVIPKLHPDLCRENVICMERIEGVKITGAGDGYDREKLAQNIIEASFKQVFEDGYFHADPHPGNILALPDNRVALLDFGQVGELTKTQRELLVSLVLALTLKDSEGIARLIRHTARSERRVRLARLRTDIEDLLERYIDMDLKSIHTGTLLSELVEVASREGLRLPPEYAMLGKGSVTISGIILQLAPGLNVDSMMKPYAQKLLADRYGSDSMGGALLKFGNRIFTTMQDIPLQLDQIVSDVEDGRLNIHVSGRSLEEAGKNIRRAALVIGSYVIAASFMTGGFVCAAAGRNRWALAGLAAGCIVAAATTFYHFLTGIRWRKVSILRMMGRPAAGRESGGGDTEGG